MAVCSLRARRVALPLLASLAFALLAALAYNLQPGVSAEAYIARYRALLDTGTGVLVEEYDYAVNTMGKSMLHREWRSSLYPEGQGEGAYVGVVSVECPPGLVGYVYDSAGRLYVEQPLTGEAREDLLKRLREAGSGGEAGCYAAGGLEPGLYHVVYRYQLHVPLTCGGGQCLLDIELVGAGEHLDYQYYRVEALGVLESWVLPLTLNASTTVSSSDAGVVVEGWRLHRYQSLRLLLLVPRPARAWGGVVEPGNPVEHAETIVSREATREKLLSATATGLLLAAVSAPLAGLLLVLRSLHWCRSRGRIPGFAELAGEEKPWMVNLLYNGDLGVFTWEALPATVLDLVARRVLRVERAGGRVFLVLPGSGEGVELDEYERDVLSLLRLYAGSDNRVDLGAVLEQLCGAERGSLARALLHSLYSPERFQHIWRGRTEHVKTRQVLGLAVALTVVAVFAGVTLGAGVEDTWLQTRLLLTGLSATLAAASLLALPRTVHEKPSPEHARRLAAWRKLVGEATLRRIALEPRLAAYLVALGYSDYAEEALRRLGRAGYRWAAEAASILADLRRHHSSYHPSGSGGGGARGRRRWRLRRWRGRGALA